MPVKSRTILTHEHEIAVRGGGLIPIERRGRDMFAAAERLDLEGIVAKRKADPYAPGVTWYKIKNRAYTHLEGRAELFHPR